MFKLFDIVLRKKILIGGGYLEKLTVKAYWRISISVGPPVGAAWTEARSDAAASDLKNLMMGNVRNQ